mmetsp:Transcript_38870/g.92028  ORF Transcript_38870/g.92028 Transcript_38870/m.92028 type:complete len:215 (+) Transcript_38870:301-945(+)
MREPRRLSTLESLASEDLPASESLRSLCFRLTLLEKVRNERMSWFSPSACLERSGAYTSSARMRAMAAASDLLRSRGVRIIAHETSSRRVAAFDIGDSRSSPALAILLRVCCSFMYRKKTASSSASRKQAAATAAQSAPPSSWDPLLDRSDGGMKSDPFPKYTSPFLQTIPAWTSICPLAFMYAAIFKWSRPFHIIVREDSSEVAFHCTVPDSP